MFVLGGDTDTRKTMRETVDFARDHRIDTLMLNILTPAPGTRQFAELDAEGRIFTRHWELYDGLHVVFMPAQIAPQELQVEVLRAYRRFYSTRRLARPSCHAALRRLRDHSWCWWFARFWRRQKENRAYLRSSSASTVPRPSPPGPPSRRPARSPEARGRAAGPALCRLPAARPDHRQTDKEKGEP